MLAFVLLRSLEREILAPTTIEHWFYANAETPSRASFSEACTYSAVNKHFVNV
jgi:hypothetical protein